MTLTVREISLTCSSQQAFEAFVLHTDRWWVPLSGGHVDPGSAPTIHPTAGGQVTAGADDSESVRLGEVMAWEPGEYLELGFGGSEDCGERHIRVWFTHTGDDACDVRFEQEAADPFPWDALIDSYQRFADQVGTGTPS